jgi:hypothetical protein
MYESSLETQRKESMNYDKDTFTTETLLSFLVKLKQLKAAAHEQAFQPKSDPRYTAVEIKIDALLERARKLVPAVMLAEVAELDALIKDLYKMFGEEEQSEITKRGN